MISFIIPAHDEAALIRETLSSLHRSATALNESYEIIVASDAWTDNTADIARRNGAKVIEVNHRQIAATRNSGAKLAGGEILIFVDADTLVHFHVLKTALRALRAGAIGGGCCINMSGPLPFYGKVLERMFQAAAPAIGLAGGCFLFCWRHAFDRAGGYDETLFAAEEVDLSLKLKRQGRFVILRQRVTTSGRKMRSHTCGQILGLFLKVARAGRTVLQQREGLELWYGPRGVE